MYLSYSALAQKQVSKNILFFAIGITSLALMFQIFIQISPLKFKILSLYIFKEN